MKNKIFYLILFFFFILISSCKEKVRIKPAGMLRLEYPAPYYSRVNPDCAFSFVMNRNANMIKKEGCDINIHYPEMKATLYMTYQPVRENNLDSLLRDAQKLAYNHTIKASSIPEQPFENPDAEVYGMYYMINGDAATQAGFYLTDSTAHFLNGALYFEAKPNFDSVYPAVMYLRNDIRRLIESLEWNR